MIPAIATFLPLFTFAAPEKSIADADVVLLPVVAADAALFHAVGGEVLLLRVTTGVTDADQEADSASPLVDDEVQPVAVAGATGVVAVSHSDQAPLSDVAGAIGVI